MVVVGVFEMDLMGVRLLRGRGMVAVWEVFVYSPGIGGGRSPGQHLHSWNPLNPPGGLVHGRLWERLQALQ